MKVPIRIGILGTGNIVVPAMVQPAAAFSDVVLAGVAARSHMRAQEFATTHHITHAYPDYETLVAAPEIDAVYNALPNGLHYEWTLRAIHHGKAVLCEKPFAANAVQAQQMHDAAQAANVILVEAVHYRYHPLALRISSILAAKTLGRLRAIDVRFRVPGQWMDPNDIRWDYQLGGGAMMDTGCYCVDLLRMVAGEEPHIVRSIAALKSPDVDQILETDLRFPGGCVGRIESSLDHYGREVDAFLRVVGENGVLEVKNPFLPHWGHSLILTINGIESSEEFELTPTYNFQLQAFIQTLRDGAIVQTSSENAILSMKVIDAIYVAAGLNPRGG